MMRKISHDIDVVITWVDGSDEQWRRQRATYKFEETGKTESDVRYRDQGTLKYVFRSLEKYAPWVNTIHFVTCGQTPAWLNTSNPKIHLVDHKEYIPSQYLPTFSSHTIELNFHRIEGLSEHFIYFNDDMLLASHVQPDCFFRNGLPCDAAVLQPVVGTVPGNAFVHYLLNNTAVINRHFCLGKIVKEKWYNWINPCYGKYNFRNLVYGLIHRNIVGFLNFHMPSPLLKSSFQKVWDLEPEILDLTCKNKFRGLSDVNPYIMSHYNFCTNQFVPRNPKYGRYIELGCAQEIIRDAVSGKYRYITINDVEGDYDYEMCRNEMISILNEVFPDKSTFEL